MDRSTSLGSSRQMGVSQAATVVSTKPTIAILVLVGMAPGVLYLLSRDTPDLHLKAILPKGENLGDMYANHMLGVETTDLGGDQRADIVASRTVVLVPQAMHQLDPRAGNAIAVPATLTGGSRESKAGKRWDDQVEGSSRIASMSARISERLNHIEIFHHVGMS